MTSECLSCEGTRSPSRLFGFRIIDQHRWRRMLVLLGIIWFMAACDLVFTLWAHWFTLFFDELNPIARALLDAERIKMLTLYKIITMAAATMLFWWTRRYRASEGALWALALGYVALMIHWQTFTRQGDELIHYKELVDEAAMPYIISPSRFAPMPAKLQAKSELITLAGSTPVRRISRPW